MSVDYSAGVYYGLELEPEVKKDLYDNHFDLVEEYEDYFLHLNSWVGDRMFLGYALSYFPSDSGFVMPLYEINKTTVDKLELDGCFWELLEKLKELGYELVPDFYVVGRIY